MCVCTVLLLHVPVPWHSDLKEYSSVWWSCSLECWEYQVLLLYIHDLGRETSSCRDGICLGLIFIGKVWGSVSKNRAGAGLEDRQASVTCGPAVSFSALPLYSWGWVGNTGQSPDHCTEQLPPTTGASVASAALPQLQLTMLLVDFIMFIAQLNNCVYLSCSHCTHAKARLLFLSAELLSLLCLYFFRGMHDILFRGVYDCFTRKNAYPGLGNGVTLFVQGERTTGSSENIESQNP